VKLGKNTSDTCAVFSEAYGGEDTKKSRVSEWHNRFKVGHMSISQTKTLLIIFFNIKGIVHPEFNP
jgi:hypothetical protein